MKLLRGLSLCALVFSLVPSIASADEPPLATRMQHRVEDTLVKPLAAREKKVSRFSRARPPPRERRVRVTQTTTSHDKAGRFFLPFAVDAKFGGSTWEEGDIVGCVYTEKGDVFVKVGDAYRPASFLLGVASEPVPGACTAAPSA